MVDSINESFGTVLAAERDFMEQHARNEAVYVLSVHLKDDEQLARLIDRIADRVVEKLKAAK